MHESYSLHCVNDAFPVAETPLDYDAYVASPIGIFRKDVNWLTADDGP